MTTAVAHINHIDAVRVGSKGNIISSTGTTDTIVIDGLTLAVTSGVFDYPFLADGVVFGFLGNTTVEVSGNNESIQYGIEKLPPTGMDYVTIKSISALSSVLGEGFNPPLAINEQIVFPTVDNTLVLDNGTLVTDSESLLTMYRIRGDTDVWELFYWVGGLTGKPIFKAEVFNLTSIDGSISNSVPAIVNIYEVDGTISISETTTNSNTVEIPDVINSTPGRKASIVAGGVGASLFDISELRPVNDVLKPLKFTPTYLFEGNEGGIGDPITPNDIWGEGNTLIQNTHIASGKAGYSFHAELNDEYGFGAGVVLDPPYVKGDTLHCQITLFAPSNEMSWESMPHLKFLRWHTTDSSNNNEGYSDIYISNENGDGPGDYGRLKYIHELNGLWSGMDEKLYHDTWETIEFQITLDDIPVSSGGTGRTRVWKKINGKMEMIQEITTEKTLNTATSICPDLKIFTYWNGGAPGSVTLYVDRIVIHDDQTTLVETDSFGRKVIGGV